MGRARGVHFLLASVLLAGCGAERPTPGRPTTIVGVTITDLSNVNELVASDISFTNDLLDLVFLQLLVEQADFSEHPPTLAPSLAESYELSDDHRIATFHLRPDAVWSDGVPITAEDVRFTWEAQRSPEIAWSFADLKEAIDDVEVVDPHTVRFRFNRDYPYQIVEANDGKILPKHVWGEVPFAEWRQRAEWFREHLVTSGPFRLASWQPGTEIVLERNARYFDPTLPKLDRVVFRVAPDAATHADQLLAGTIDFACGMTPADASRLAHHPELRVIPYETRQYDYIVWNTRRVPFDDPAVRRALTLAIDRQALVDTLFRGYAVVGSSPIPAAFWPHDRELVPWPYDPEEAKRLLAAAGFADRDGDGVLDRGGKPLRFELSTNSSNRFRSDALVMIQEQLRRVGVDARPRTVEIHTLNELNQAHDFDATLMGWAVDTTFDLRSNLHSSEIDGGYNFGSFSDPEVDRLLEATRRAKTPEEARPDLVRIQRILHQSQPFTFLWEPQRICVVRSDLENVRPNSLSAYFNLAQWTRRFSGG